MLLKTDKAWSFLPDVESSTDLGSVTLGGSECWPHAGPI